ncbi:TIGR03936 family radical SAM-associated protein [Lutispora sp.]|uniref:TIGR03936 family radical SAM-associated protein n=1 Tax=Lutispora sp. TaxID=2828727 RepID=UPI002B20041E|nr:TIGR03936 family radical SAM-associated protein [Lutispora sp.]MEA4960475.1 TIGR03936 family radical SAM-associated protein [Lutispora sp.]
MINMRLKFIKGRETKYISHLDLLRTFQRALRRAHIPMAYSGGFNPHPEMSFASALGVGLTSMGEYLDIGVNEEISGEDVIMRLNAVLPVGLRVENAVVLKEKPRSGMALVSHARYNIYLRFEKDIDIEDCLRSFLAQDNILAVKQQPKKDFKTIEIDIKPMIREIKALSQGGGEVVLDCVLSSGSKANLKPELMLQALKKQIGDIFEDEKIERIDLYSDMEGELTPLLLIDNA